MSIPLFVQGGTSHMSSAKGTQKDKTSRVDRSSIGSKSTRAHLNKDTLSPSAEKIKKCSKDADEQEKLSQNKTGDEDEDSPQPSPLKLLKIDTINLSGKRYMITYLAFSCLKWTLRNKATIIFNKDSGKNEYFLTRNSYCFEVILDYFENGRFHIPPTVCPFALRDELRFWGIKIRNVEACCIEKFYDTVDDKLFIQATNANIKAETVRDRGWQVITNSPRSRLGYCFLAVKTIAIILFIFESCASTHPEFQETIRYDQLPDYMERHRDTFTVLCRQSDNSQDNDKLNVRKHLCDKFRNVSQSWTESISNNNTSNIPSSRKRKMAKNYAKPVKKERRILLPSGRLSEYLTEQDRILGQRVGQQMQDNNTSIDKTYFTDYKIQIVAEYNTSKEKIISEVYYDNNTGHTTENQHNHLIFEDSGYIDTKPANTTADSRIERRSNDLMVDTADIFTKQVLMRIKPASRTKRNIEIERIHKEDDIDHTKHPEDLVIYQTNEWLDVLELVVTVYFLVEYFVELIFAPNKLRYVISFHSFIDISTAVSVLILHIHVYSLHPELKYRESFLEILKAVESLKTLKLFFVIKENHFVGAIIFTFKQSIRDLVSLFAILFCLMIIVAFFMFYNNKDDMHSIPAAMGWAMGMTLGYEKVVPSLSGNILGFICASAGIVLLSLTIPIFLKDFNEYRRISKTAPELRAETIQSVINRTFPMKRMYSMSMSGKQR